MSLRCIAILNQSLVLPDRDFDIMVRACDSQLERDVAPLWEKEPWPVRAYDSESRLPKRSLPIRIVDDPEDVDDDDALGWHFEQGDGRPYGRVFVSSVMEGTTTPAQRRKRLRRTAGAISVVLSHEVIEAFIDPDINLWAYDPGRGVFHAYEACDPVQDQSYTVQVTGGRARVSNFVTPSWFDAENRNGTRFDYLGKLKKPFTNSRRGYTTTNKASSKDVQVFGLRALPRQKRHRIARTALRQAMAPVCR